MNFKIKDMAHLNNILEGRPISIASVRHPFERLVSAYLDRDNVETGKRLKGKTFEQFLTEDVLKIANSSQNERTFL